MAPNLAVTQQLLREAGGLVMEEPYSGVASARNFVQHECKLHPLAFGVTAIPGVTIPYEGSRDYQQQNLDKGVELMENISRGLAVAAGMYDSMEAANTVTPEQVVPVETGQVDSPGVIDSAPGVIPSGIEIYVKWAVALGCGIAATGMTPFAAAAPAVWALVQPDDAAIDAAITGWRAAEAKLGGVTFDAITSRLDDGDSPWEGDGRDTFDTFLTWVVHEIEQTKTAAGNNASQLQTIQTTLDGLVIPFMTFSIVNLALVACYFGASFIPFVGPAFNALCHIQGGIMSLFSVLQVTTQTAMVVAGLGGTVAATAYLGQGFAEQQPNLGPGMDFDQLEISWAEPVV